MNALFSFGNTITVRGIWKDEVGDIQNLKQTLKHDQVVELFEKAPSQRSLYEQAQVDASILYAVKGDSWEKSQFEKKLRSPGEKLFWYKNQIYLAKRAKVDARIDIHMKEDRKKHPRDKNAEAILDIWEKALPTPKDENDISVHRKRTKTIDFIISRIDMENETKVPTSVKDAAEEQVILSILSGSTITKHHSLAADELVILELADVSYSEERVTKSEGTYGGLSIRATKRVSVKGGAFSSQPKREITEIDSGKLLITTKKMIFDGAKTFKEIPYSKMRNWNVKNHALELSIAGKQKKEFYSNINNYPSREIELVPKHDEKWLPTTLTWELNDLNFFSILKRIIKKQS